MNHFEKNYATSRIGRGGEERLRAKLAYAIFQHITARTQDSDVPDMHVHWHVTVFNACTRDRENGEVDSGAAELAAFYTRQRLLSAEFDTAMYEVFRDMGYLTQGQAGDSRLEAVPPPLHDAYSKRAQAVEEEMRRSGEAGHEAHERAWRKTRETKKHLPRDELFASWQADLDRHGFTQEVFNSHRHAIRSVNLIDETTAAFDRVDKNLTKRQSYFTEARYLEHVCIETRGRGIPLDFIIDAVKYRLHNPRHTVDLGTIDNDHYYTTTEMMAAEKKYLGLLEGVKQRNSHKVSEASVLRAIAETEEAESKKRGTNVKLTAEQIAAVYRFTRGEDGIATLTGDAGTGKSLCCSAVRRAFELDGFQVIGCALAKKAAINLEEASGIKSYSVAKLIGSEELGFIGDLDKGIVDRAKHALRQMKKAFVASVHEDLKNVPVIGNLLPRAGKPSLYNPVTVDDKTVVICDEAGMVGLKEMTLLVEKLQERGSRLCMVGDAKQLQPITAGNPFKAAVAVLDPEGQSRLTRIVRQKKKEDRQAVRALSRGDAKEAFDSYLKRGLLHVAKTQKDAMRQIIDDWRKEGMKKPKENLLLCATNAERRELNRLAQAEMKKGKLGRRAFTAGGEDFHRGDRIAFTQNNTFYGVQKGSMGTIQRIGTKRITRKLIAQRQYHSFYAMLKYLEKVKKDKTLWMTVKLDNGQVVDIRLDNYQHFRLGYALNTHQAQGQTVDNVHILTGGSFGLDREMIYVQASRARNSPRIYATALEADARRPTRDTVTELAKRASKSRAKELAHDVRDKAQKQSESHKERFRLRIHH
jgi:ATP-dependent exoDNAse (exonuclease V) alpha subunit